MLAPVFMAAALAAWPTPLISAVQAESVAPKAAFTAQIKTGTVQMSVEYDPARAEAQRWLVKYPSGRPVNKDEQTTLDALKRTNPARDYACATRTEIIPPEVTLKSETADEYVYGYKPRATAKTPKQTAAALKTSLGEIRVSKASGRILGGRTWTTAPFKPAPIAKVNSYTESFECGQGGFLTKSLFNVDFSALGTARKIWREMVLSDIRVSP